MGKISGAVKSVFGAVKGFLCIGTDLPKVSTYPPKK